MKSWTALNLEIIRPVQSVQADVSDQSNFYLIVIISLVCVTIVSLLIIMARKRHIILTQNQHRVAIASLVLGLVFTVGAIAATPINQNQVPLSFRDINVIMQSLWLSLLLVSMWFRNRGNYLMHGILALVVVSITVMGFLGVLIMSPMNNSSMNEYFGSPAAIAVFFAHSVVSFPALVFGVWLVALWRPYSTSFPAKTQKIAKLTTVFWVLSYIVGILDFLLLRTNFG